MSVMGLAAVYAAGMVVATVSGWVAAQKLRDRDQPAARLVLWGVVAGVLWPVLLVGIVELVGVWMLAKALARGRARDPDPLCDCDALPRNTELCMCASRRSTDSTRSGEALMAAAHEYDRLT
jgi:hypothetical protein